MTSGTASNETDGYDLNGNTTTVTIGGSTFHDAYDDEDRLTSVAIPGGFTDTYTYNGLGLRVGKVDSTGSYSYICDGTTPGSPVLSDGHAVYTPGLSENRGGTSTFYDFDRLGNLWTLDGSGKSQLGYADYSGFGGGTAAAGATSPFGFGGGNGCQTDADTGIVLMGHRYYDSRIGRFLTQDPAKAGGNWYSYAGNNPVNKTDPSGLVPMDGPGSSAMGSPGYMGGGGFGNGSGEDDYESFANNQRVDQNIADHKASVLKAGEDWYMNGMGGTSNAVNKWLMASTASNFGQVTGDYDSGKASGAQVTLAGGELFGMALLNAVPAGKWAAGGFQTLKITGGLLGSDVHFIYGLGGKSLHALYESRGIYRIMEVSPSMSRLYRPLFSVRVPALFPSAAMQVGGTASDCLFAALAAGRRGLVGR